MARDLHNDFKTEIIKDVVSPIILAKINTSGGDVRAWTGFGKIIFNGEEYIGGGNLVSVSEVVEETDLSAQGVAVSLSGIPADILAISLGQVQHGRPATLWLGLMDNNLSLIADPYEIYSGFTDVTSISEQGETSTITINIENRLIALERSKIRRYTDQIQRQTYPNDKGFEFVAGLQEKEYTFGDSD